MQSSGVAAGLFVPGKMPEGSVDGGVQHIKCTFCALGCFRSKLTGGLQVFFKQAAVPLGISRLIAGAQALIAPSCPVGVAFECPGTLNVGWALGFWVG